MISYGAIPLQLAGPEEAAFIAANIPIEAAFGFFRPKFFGNSFLDPRSLFNWWLNKPIRLNVLTQPWGASRWGHAFVLADANMLAAIEKQNNIPANQGGALLFSMDDSLGSVVSTPMLMLPPVPLAKVLGVAPQLPLWLLPLVDSRYRFWEAAAAVTVTEGTTAWTDLYAAIGSALGIALSVDPVSSNYLAPSAAFTQNYQPLPLLLDLVAASVGQRIVRRLNGSFAAINASTATALQVSQANAQRKYAGGALALGVLDA